MITVDYLPGVVDPVHRHDAHAFIYVLQGSIVMQVWDGKEVTLVPGQTIYEGPNEVHTVGRNACTTEPAKFIVNLLKKRGVDVMLPARRNEDDGYQVVEAVEPRLALSSVRARDPLIAAYLLEEGGDCAMARTYREVAIEEILGTAPARTKRRSVSGAGDPPLGLRGSCSRSVKGTPDSHLPA